MTFNNDNDNNNYNNNKNNNNNKYYYTLAVLETFLCNVLIYLIIQIINKWNLLLFLGGFQWFWDGGGWFWLLSSWLQMISGSFGYFPMALYAFG